MKIDIVHVDKDDPLYKVIVIDDFFDDFENIKMNCINYFHENNYIENDAFPGYEANMKNFKEFNLQELMFKKVVDVMNYKKMLDNITYSKYIELYKPDILTRTMCIKNENYNVYNKNIIYKSPHTDSPEPKSNLNCTQIQVLLYLVDKTENYNGTNFWNRVYIEQIPSHYFFDKHYPFKNPLTTIDAKKNRCLIYYSNMPHNANIDYLKMTEFERYTLNTQIQIKTDNILNDNFNFKSLR